MDQDYGTNRPKVSKVRKEQPQLDLDDFDAYGMELGESDGSSEDDNYYQGVSLNKQKPVRQVDQPSTLDMGLDSVAESEQADERADQIVPKPIPEVSLDREQSIVTAQFGSVPHSPGAVPVGQSLPKPSETRETKNAEPAKNKKRRKVNDDYGIFYNYTNESESSQNNISKPQSPELTEVPYSPANGIKSQISFGHEQQTLSHVNEKNSHLKRPQSHFTFQSQNHKRPSSSSHQRTESGNIDTLEAEERNLTYKPYSPRQKNHKAQNDKDRLESVAMLNMYNQNATDGIAELFEGDKALAEKVMSRVDWIIVIREIFYELLGQQPSGAKNLRNEEGTVRGDVLFKAIVAAKNTLKLVSREQYMEGQQRHEIQLSYSKILRNLKRKISLSEIGQQSKSHVYLTVDQAIDIAGPSDLGAQTLKSAYTGTEIERYTDVQNTVLSRQSRASPLLSNAQYDNARVAGYGVATAQGNRPEDLVNVANRTSTPQIHIAHERKDRSKAMSPTQQRCSSVDSGVRPGLSSEDIEIITDSRDSNHRLQNLYGQSGQKSAAGSSRNGPNANLTDSGRKRSYTHTHQQQQSPSKIGPMNASVSIPNYRSPSKQGHTFQSTTSLFKYADGSDVHAHKPPKLLNEWQPLDQVPGRTSNTPMDQQLSYKFTSSVTGPVWNSNTKKYDSSAGAMNKHAGAVEQRSQDKKHSPFKFAKTQKLHFKDLPKQKRKTESIKKRVSPANKRKTPGKFPKQIGNYLRESQDDRQESPPKMAGITLAQQDKQGSFVQRHELSQDADDVRSDHSHKYTPHVSFPNMLQQQVRMHKSTETLNEFTQERQNTQLNFVDSGIRHEVASIEGGFNTMTSSQWMGLLQTATEKSPPQATTTVDRSMPAVNNFFTKETKEDSRFVSQRQKIVPLQQVCGPMLEEASNKKEFLDFDFYNKDLKESQQASDVDLRKGIKTHLRSINLGRNLLKRFRELAPAESKQLLILNLSLNQIESTTGLTQCIGLQFLNLAYNQISCPREVNKLRQLHNLQELYLAHNFVDFDFKQEEETAPIPQSGYCWPFLEILDLSSNRLSDACQLRYLFTGLIVNADSMRVISAHGNRLQESECQNLLPQVDFTLDYCALISTHSQYTTQKLNQALVRACVGCESTSLIQSEVAAQIQKVEMVKEQSERHAMLVNTKRTPNQLSYLLKKNSKGPTMSPTKLNSSSISQSQAQLKPTPSFSPTKTGFKPPYERLVQNYRSPMTENMLVQSIGRNKQTQAAQRKQKSRTHSQEDIKAQYLVESPPIKRQSPRNGPKFARTGIKQIQMVYLNPSRCGSRRSSSIPSNPTSSRQSTARRGRSASGDKLSIHNAYTKEGPPKGKGLRRNRSFSSKQSGSNKRVISPRMTSTPLLDSLDRLPTEKPAQMLGLYTEQRLNQMSKMQHFASVRSIAQTTQSQQKKPHIMKLDKVQTELHTKLNTPHQTTPLSSQNTYPRMTQQHKKANTVKKSQERKPSMPRKSGIVGQYQKTFMPQGLAKSGLTKLKGLNKANKDQGGSSEKEYQIPEKSLKVGRESSKSNKKSQGLSRNPSNESSFLKMHHDTKEKKPDKAKIFSYIIAKPSTKTPPIRTFGFQLGSNHIRGKSISMQKIKPEATQGLQPYSSATMSLKQLTFNTSIGNKSNILQKLQQKNKGIQQGKNSNVKKLRLMANFAKNEKSGPSSFNSTGIANATHVSDIPLNLNIPPSSMSMSTRNIKKEGSSVAVAPKQFMYHPHAANNNFFNSQEQAQNPNDESAASASMTGQPSPRACEALLASEKLESEATIPRSHKTHKTSSFVKVAAQGPNSFLQTTQNSSILSSNALRLKEMTIAKPPSGVMGQESEQRSRQDKNN